VTLRDVIRHLVGAIIGGGVAILSVWLAAVSGQTAAYSVLVVLAVSLVGLTLGSGPAIAAFALAGAILVGFTLPAGTHLITSADVVRLVAFAVGSPIVIALAVRAERRQSAARQAQGESLAAEQLANAGRREADAAHRS
jgi:hypothetical protein